MFVLSIAHPLSQNAIEDVENMTSFLSNSINKLTKNPEVFILDDINCDLNKTYALSTLVSEFL